MMCEPISMRLPGAALNSLPLSSSESTTRKRKRGRGRDGGSERKESAGTAELLANPPFRPEGAARGQEC
eukprot:5181126-Heterocapsa_arctica.AAC.1